MKHDEYISGEMVVKRVNATVKIGYKKKRALDVSIVTYDRETRVIHQKNSDGPRAEGAGGGGCGTFWKR